MRQWTIVLCLEQEADMEDTFRDTLADLPWTAVRDLAARRAVVLLPIGSLEEHGPHLPLSTDLRIARLECLRLRDVLAAEGVEAVLGPPFFWGICQANDGFPGSFRARRTTVAALVVDLLANLHAFGFRTVVGVNAHNDVEHAIALLDGFREAGETPGLDARLVFPRDRLAPFGLSGDEPYLCVVRPAARAFGSVAHPDVHAGDLETAAIRSAHPHLADVAVATGLPPVALPDSEAMAWLFGGQTARLSPEGYLGDPAAHAAADAAGFLQDTAERIAEAMRLRRSGEGGAP
jgi:creatinine amidohydrolase